MTEQDKKLVHPISLFVSKLDELFPGEKRKLRELVVPDLVADATEFSTEAKSLTDKNAWTFDGKQALEALEAELDETKFMVTELSLYVRAATVRDEAAEEALQPRIGRSADEFLANMEAISDRLEKNKAWLKERKVVVWLPPHLSADAVRKQGAAHRKAAVEIARVRTDLDGTQKKLESLRARGNALQSRINRLLEYLFPEDRGTQLQFGYSERSKSRAKKAESKPAPAPAPEGEGENEPA